VPSTNKGNSGLPDVRLVSVNDAAKPSTSVVPAGPSSRMRSVVPEGLATLNPGPSAAAICAAMELGPPEKLMPTARSFGLVVELLFNGSAAGSSTRMKVTVFFVPVATSV
jgi:hypothetical protein